MSTKGWGWGQRQDVKVEVANNVDLLQPLMKYSSKYEFKISRHTGILFKYLSNVFEERCKEGVQAREKAFSLCLGLFYYQLVKSMWHTAAEKQQHSLAWIFPFFRCAFFFVKTNSTLFPFFIIVVIIMKALFFPFFRFNTIFFSYPPVLHGGEEKKRKGKKSSRLLYGIFLILLICAPLCRCAYRRFSRGSF